MMVVEGTLFRAFVLSAAVLTGWSVGPVAAGASEPMQLHQLLFNRAKREQRRQRLDGAVPVRQAAARRSQRMQPRQPARRVSGPSYYSYAKPVLSTVTIASLFTDARTTGSIDTDFIGPHPAGSVRKNRFIEAMARPPQAQLKVEPAIAAAVRDHYARNPAFLWVDDMDAGADGRAVAKRLASVADHGLDAADYAVEVPGDYRTSQDETSRYRDLVVFEMRLTARAIRYAMDIKDGAVDPNKLSGYHDFADARLKPAVAMAALAQASGAVAWLDGLVPRQPEYKALQAELAGLRTQTDDAIGLPQGIMLRPGMVDEALPLVMAAVERKISGQTRAKHASALDAYAGTTLYEGALVALIKDMQSDLGLATDGIVGPNTASRLDGESLATRIARVELALERLRWHPEDYAARQVVVNQPEYRVRYLEDGQTRLSMRAIVGTKSNQTYFFHDEIEHVVYDPYWGVPQSIIVSTYLPRLRRNPSYFDRNGFVVTTTSGRRVASSAINWTRYRGSVPFNVRQKPGPSNALGELKIMFPNRHAIYMHDTPNRRLFARDNRALSHGCVRLEDPRAMAAAVLGASVAHVTAQLGGYEQVERLAEKVPVYVAYFTAWPDDDGVIDYHRDIYERDRHLIDAMATVNQARSG